jgi:hypothetical protein
VRRPNRNVEIFSMSALDLFAAALGGFVMISIILFPNYLKQQRTELSLRETKGELEQTKHELGQTKEGLGQCKASEAAIAESLKSTSESLKSKTQEVAECEAALATTFLVIVIEWSQPGNYDVDLHVTDPAGHEFSFDKNNRDRRDFPSTEAQLTYDNTRGPGIELWQHPKAPLGSYKVSYVYYSAPGANLPIEVKGSVLYRGGRVELPLMRLTERRTLRPVARVVVRERGQVDVQGAQ